MCDTSGIMVRRTLVAVAVGVIAVAVKPQVVLGGGACSG